jgi:cytoskeletal protein RodZ
VRPSPRDLEVASVGGPGKQADLQARRTVPRYRRVEARTARNPRAGPAPTPAAAKRESQPTSLREAQLAASEAMEEEGTRGTSTRIRENLERPTLPHPTPEEIEKAPAPANKDPLGKVPMQRDDGTPATSTRNSQKSYRHRPRPLPPAEIEQAAATGKKNDPLRSLGHPNCREFREPYHTASRDCARRPSQVR